MALSRLGLCALAAAACGAEPAMLRPIIDVPDKASPAYPYDELDRVVLSVAQAGAKETLRAATFRRGQALTVTDVPYASDLVVHMSGQFSGAEVAYGRTCAVAVREDEEPPEPQLYFSRVATWATAPDPEISQRIHGHAYAPPDGSAVFVGGGPQVSRVERFDPTKRGAFSSFAGTTAARPGAVLAPFLDGRALIVGGTLGAGDTLVGVSFVEIVNPAASRQREVVTANIGPAVRGHAATTLADGRILVCGGETQPQGVPGSPFLITRDAHLFSFGAGGQAVRQGLPGTMVRGRAGHTLTRLGDDAFADVLVVGGHDGADALVAEAELYRPLSRVFVLLPTSQMVVPRWGHAALPLPAQRVLVVGGTTGTLAAPIPVSTVEVYDPHLGQFQDAGTLPANAGVTELSVTPLPDGRILLAGGRDAMGMPVSMVLIATFDPQSGGVALSTAAPMAAPRAGHSAVRLCDGTVLIVGGTDDPKTPGAERYNPLSDERR
jgi:hypothetical protein